MAWFNTTDHSGYSNIVQDDGPSGALYIRYNPDGSFKYETNTWKNPATGLYEEYGINASSKTSADGSFENQTPLRKYRYETRVDVTGDTRVNPGNGANNTNYLFYSPNFSDGMQILFHGTYSDIKV